MLFTEGDADKNQVTNSASKKRRLRRKRLNAARAVHKDVNKPVKTSLSEENNIIPTQDLNGNISRPHEHTIGSSKSDITKFNLVDMSSKDDNKSREDILAAREAKKLAKLKGKGKPTQSDVSKPPESQKNEDQSTTSIDNSVTAKIGKENEVTKKEVTPESPKSKDEVDKAVIQVKPDITQVKTVDKSKDDVKAERAAKKAAKQAKKKIEDSGDASAENMTVQDVVETLKDIVNVAKEVQDVTAKVQAINLEPKKSEENVKSKAELRAERRAKQEAQRAAKQATVQKAPAAKPETKAKSDEAVKPKEEKSPKVKSVEKPKSKQQSVNRVNWFQHLHTQQDAESLKKIPINSNLHPAIIKLGVQLATRVVSGSNARCIALLDALKKMVRDYTLPAKTEFARGLEAHLAASLEFLWGMRQPSASQTNAVKCFRHHLTQLPNNVDEFDAKKTLQEEIDRYIREQIDMAGEAISLTVRNKISDGDNILTYGCSSLIERILCEAHEGGVRFRAVVAGARVGAGARAGDALRRLRARGVPAAYLDVTAVSYVMPTINKVLLGASALLVNGSVLGAAGTAQVALVAKSFNVPVLVACETHKFSERVQTDAFVYNEIGDPDELVDKSDENSPIKDWRSNPNLTLLNLTYDVTPPSLVTAVVTELAILPCTSAPVVLRFKLSEYGI